MGDSIITDASYERVSDDKKKDDGSKRQDVNRQHTLIKEHYGRMGITSFKRYVDDGKSAFTEDLNQRPAFKQLLNERSNAIKNRIRWRQYDKDDDGKLIKGEIDELCECMLKNPDRNLFICESDRNPTTHPRYRDRILHLFKEKH